MESPALITEKAFRFIDAALEHSLTTGTTRDELELQLQDVQSPNPWLALHIDNILRRRSTPSVADLEGVTTLDSRVKAIVSRKRLNLYLSSNVQPEPDILTLLVQSDDHVISLEAFGQGVNLLESPN
jgi:class 3 adenylate cyclase